MFGREKKGTHSQPDGCKRLAGGHPRARGWTLGVYLLALSFAVLAAAFAAFNNMYKMHVAIQLNAQRLEMHAADRYWIRFERFGKSREKRVTASDGFLKFLLSANAEDFRLEGLGDEHVNFISINGTAIKSFGSVRATLKAEKRKLQGKFLLFSAGIAIPTTLVVALVAILHYKRRALLNSRHTLRLQALWRNQEFNTAWLVLFFGLFSLNLLFNLRGSQATGLDASWVLGINRASDSGCIYGKDVVFTYGPLGYLLEPYGYGSHLYQAWLLGAACVIIQLGLFAIYCKNNPQARDRLAVFALFWLLFFVFASNEWAFNFMTLFAAMLLWTVQDRRGYFYGLSFLLACLSGLALLMKLNSGILAASIAGLLGAALLLHDRKRLPGFLLVYGATYLAILTAAIVFLFAGPINFANWLRLSAEMVRGYGTAMVTNDNSFFVLLALAGLGVYVRLVIGAKKDGLRSFALAVLAAPYLFFAFKQGFVRQDRTHMFIYFSAVPFAMGLVYLLSPPSLSATARRAFITNTLLCAFFLCGHKPSIIVVKSTAANIAAMARFHRNRQGASALNQELLKRERFADWNEIIGGESIQILPTELVYAEINHWPGWRPNPVFQLYAAYTGVLDEFSARSFHGQKAPRFIMLEFSFIDDRNMFLDTPATWNSILPNYSVVKYDLDKALLQRRAEDVTPAFERTSESRHQFGDTIQIPDHREPVYARIRIEPTVCGKIWAFLFRGALPELLIQRQNGAESRYRIVPETLATPVPISHIPDNLTQLLDLASGRKTERFKATSFKFRRGASPFFFYRNSIQIEWLRSATNLAR